MLTVAVLGSWVASTYRIVVSLTQPRTLWRTSFTVVTLSVAVSSTLYLVRAPIDQLLGVPNLAGLLARMVIIAGVGFLLAYLHTLRVEKVPRSALVRYAVIIFCALATLAITWFVGSFRGREADDLLRARPTATLVLYCLAFWLVLASGLFATAWTCLGRWRTARHQDLAREISLLLISLGAIVGLIVCVLWTASLALTVARLDGSAFNEAGDRLLPAASGLVALGVMSLFIVPYVASLVVLWRRSLLLRPLWVALIETYPEIHLNARPRGGPRTRLQFRQERMIIESLDALRIAPVAGVPPDLSAVVAVAGPLFQGKTSGADLLDHSDSREADVDLLLALAGSFVRRRDVAA